MIFTLTRLLCFVTLPPKSVSSHLHNYFVGLASNFELPESNCNYCFVYLTI